MSTPENKTGLPLVHLGITRPEELAPLFADLRGRFDEECASARDESSWKQFRNAWLGANPACSRKSPIIGSSPPLRNSSGASARNSINSAPTSSPKSKSAAKSIESGAEETASARDRVDLSLPGAIRPIGSHHLIRQVFQQIEDIFSSIGFSVVEGPEIETPYYNFEALNIPEFHPVRDDMDTFYLDLPKGASQPLLLRTHTSPMQIRTMEKRQPPVRVIVPARSIAAIIPTPPIPSSFTRSKASRSTPISRSAISPAPSNISLNNFSALA